MMLDRFEQRLNYIWQVCRWPTASQFQKLSEISQQSILDSLLLLLVGAVVILFGVAVFSGVEARLLELFSLAVAMFFGLLLWTAVAYLYARLLGGRAESLFASFLYLTSSALLTLLILAIFLSYLPIFGPVIGLAMIIYSQVLAVFTFRYLAGVGWLLSVLGTLATSVVSIGLFQLIGSLAFTLATGNSP